MRFSNTSNGYSHSSAHRYHCTPFLTLEPTRLTRTGGLMFVPWDNKDKLLTRRSSEASRPCLPLPMNRSYFLSSQKCLCLKPERVGEAGGVWEKSTEIREINISLWEWKNWRSNRCFSIKMHATSLEFNSRNSWELASRRHNCLSSHNSRGTCLRTDSLAQPPTAILQTTLSLITVQFHSAWPSSFTSQQSCLNHPPTQVRGGMH